MKTYIERDGRTIQKHYLTLMAIDKESLLNQEAQLNRYYSLSMAGQDFRFIPF